MDNKRHYQGWFTLVERWYFPSCVYPRWDKTRRNPRSSGKIWDNREIHYIFQGYATWWFGKEPRSVYNEYKYIYIYEHTRIWECTVWYLVGNSNWKLVIWWRFNHQWEHNGNHVWHSGIQWTSFFSIQWDRPRIIKLSSYWYWLLPWNMAVAPSAQHDQFHSPLFFLIIFCLDR